MKICCFSVNSNFTVVKKNLRHYLCAAFQMLFSIGTNDQFSFLSDEMVRFLDKYHIYHVPCLEDKDRCFSTTVKFIERIQKYSGM